MEKIGKIPEIDPYLEIETTLSEYCRKKGLPDDYFKDALNSMQLDEVYFAAHSEMVSRDELLLLYQRAETNDDEFFTVAGDLLVALGVVPAQTNEITTKTLKKLGKFDPENCRICNLSTSIPGIRLNIQYTANFPFTDREAIAIMKELDFSFKEKKPFIYPVMLEFYAPGQMVSKALANPK